LSYLLKNMSDLDQRVTKYVLTGATVYQRYMKLKLSSTEHFAIFHQICMYVWNWSYFPQNIYELKLFLQNIYEPELSSTENVWTGAIIYRICLISRVIFHRICLNWSYLSPNMFETEAIFHRAFLNWSYPHRICISELELSSTEICLNGAIFIIFLN
jgi:hypothetical protein